MSTVPNARILLLVLPALIALIGGVVTLFFGMRGRRVDDHPLCRRCGFDLIGLPQGVSLCSECGADLTKHKAIRHGHRKRQPVLLAIGLIPVLLALGLTGLGVTAYMRDIGIDRMKPTWLLLRESRDPTAVSVWDELIRRMNDGALPSDTAAALTDRVLAWQGDAKQAWRTKWGDYVEAARDARIVTDAQWQQYARQAPQFALELRPRVRKGDDIPAMIRNTAARLGMKSRFRLRISEIDHAGELTKPRPRSWGSGSSTFGLFGQSGGSASGHTIQLDHDASRAAVEGEREAHLDVAASILEGRDDAEPLVKWKQGLDAKWTLVAADAETVKIVDDESLRPAVERALTIRSAILQRWDRRVYLRVDIRCDNPPIPLAYEAFARDPTTGREWKLSTTTLNVNTMTGSGVSGPVIGFTGSRIDIIFRPSLKAAHGTTWATRVWNGEVVLKNQPVTRDETWDANGRMTPASRTR
ncbi:MAG: hypothetical protein ABIP55_15465 [Tepidisphaeraceae bacterium]